MRRKVFKSQVFRVVGAAFYACPLAGDERHRVPQFMDHPPEWVDVVGFEFCGVPVSEKLARRVLAEGYDAPDCLAVVTSDGRRCCFAYTS